MVEPKKPITMVSVPVTTAFSLLLDRLDPEPESASIKYEELRRRIAKILQWKGCPESEADALADISLDRIAEKLSGGTNIENLNAYAAGVVRFVWLEHSRKRMEDAVGDDLPEIAIQPSFTDFEDSDERLACLRKCLAEIAVSYDDRRVIIGYYDNESDKNKDIRKDLAESLGLSASALRVRACRLRARLEICINDCIGGVTNPVKNDTRKQEAL